MQVVQGKDFSFFDVDDTLVSWDYPERPDDAKYAVGFTDPSSGAVWMLTPIQKTIEALKQGKRAGSTIVVWSAGGWEWAQEVVKTLGLEEFVDAVISKPNRYYDDLPAAEILGTRYDLREKSRIGQEGR